MKRLWFALVRSSCVGVVTRSGVQESKHKPALYLPRADVPAALLEDSATSTYCPFKGTASYHSALGVSDVLWYYPEPYVEVDYLVDYVGLYQDRVSSITFGGV